MFKTVTFCENCFGTRNSFPNSLGVCWGTPTPLRVAVGVSYILTFLIPRVKFSIQERACHLVAALRITEVLDRTDGDGIST